MSGWTTQPDLRQLFNLINGKKHVIKRSWCQVKLRNLTYTNDLFQQSEKLVSKNFLMSGPRAGPDLRELLNPIIGKTYWYACVLVVRFKNGTWPCIFIVISIKLYTEVSQEGEGESAPGLRSESWDVERIPSPISSQRSDGIWSLRARIHKVDPKIAPDW